jgi:paraquat-inducible protein B
MTLLLAASGAWAQALPDAAVDALAERLEAAIGRVSPGSEPLPEGVPFLVRFAEDVGGLAVGSPVTVKGLRVGTVRDVAVVLDTATATIDVPVVIDVVPERITVDGERPGDEVAVYALAERLVANGLRAVLESAGPLGGSQHVGLAFDPEAVPAVLDRGGRYPEIPTSPSLTERLQATLDGLLARVAALPVEQVVDEAMQALRSMNALLTGPELDRLIDAVGAAGDEVTALVTGPEVKEVLASLAASGRDLQALVGGLQGRLDPSVEALQAAAAGVEAVTRETRAFVAGLDRTVGPRSPLWSELLQISRELAGTSRSLRLLLEYLERHPDALLRGRPETVP